MIQQAKAMESTSIPSTNLSRHREVSQIQVPQSTSVILYDGSWDQQGNAGMEVVIYNTIGELVLVHAGAFQASHPIESEALAMLWALNMIKGETSQQRNGNYVCFGDCKILTKAMQHNNLDQLPHWKAAEAVKQCVANFELVHQLVQVQQIPREAVQEAHQLANWAR